MLSGTKAPTASFVLSGTNTISKHTGTSRGSPYLKGKTSVGECVVAFRELWGFSTSGESHTAGLVKLADIYIKWRYITEKRMGSRREWILTNRSAGNSRCGTVMDAFRRERIFTPNKRKQLYLLLSKAHQETGIMTAGASSKSGVFTIQLTCSTGLSLRADSSRTGTPSRSAYESNRPHDVNKPGSRVSSH